MSIVGDADELWRDPNPARAAEAALPAHAPFQHILHTELGGDRREGKTGVLVVQGGRARDHAEARDLSQAARDLLSDSVREVLILCGAEVLERKILVLPFQNLGAAQDQYFADGVTEEITSRLGQISRLGVISRTTALHYKNTSLPLTTVASELGVQYVLEGSVRWERGLGGASRVRVTPQLIRVSDDTHLWTDRYDAVLADIFQVQGEIASKVARALGVTLGAGERKAVAVPGTANLEAYDQFLRGNSYFDRPQDPGNLRLAIQAYERAVALDSNYALAYCGLANAHLLVYFWNIDWTERRLALAKGAVDRALALEPDLPPAHVALAQYYYWGLRAYDQALAELGIARKALPNDPSVVEKSMSIHRRQGKGGGAGAEGGE